MIVSKLVLVALSVWPLAAHATDPSEQRIDHRRQPRAPSSFPVSLFTEHGRLVGPNPGETFGDLRRKLLEKYSSQMLERHRRRENNEYVYAPRAKYINDNEVKYRKEKAAADRARRRMPVEGRARIIFDAGEAKTWDEALEKANEYILERKKTASLHNKKYYDKQKRLREELVQTVVDLENAATSPTLLPEDERTRYFDAKRRLQEIDEKTEKEKYARRLHYRVKKQKLPIEKALTVAAMPHFVKNTDETKNALEHVRKDGRRDPSKPETDKQERQRRLWAASKYNQRKRGRQAIRKETLENPEITSTFERVRQYKQQLKEFHARLRGARQKKAGAEDEEQQDSAPVSAGALTPQQMPFDSHTDSQSFDLDAAESIGSAEVPEWSQDEAREGAVGNEMQTEMAPSSGAPASTPRSPSPDAIMASHFRTWWQQPHRH